MKAVYFLVTITMGTAITAVYADVATVQPITLVAAPRGSEVDETALYGPIASYLEEKVGRPVRYVYIADWLSYRKAIKDNNYDIFFNGPHFSGWLVTYREHRLVARLAESHTFVAITKSGNSHVTKIKDLAGRASCLHAPPNLGTEIFNSAFDNPARQPHTILITGWKAAFEGVVSGRCAGAILPDTVLNKLNGTNEVKVIHRFPSIANQAFTATNRLPSKLIADLREAMRAPSANVVGAKLLAAYASKGFVEAKEADYTSAADFLKDDFSLGHEIANANVSAPPSTP